MKFKTGVKFDGLCPEMWYALGVIDECYKQVADKELVVTAALDGKHHDNSLHYKGKAVDCRTRDLNPQQKQALFNYVNNRLNPIGFDVVFEEDHLHAEFQPKENETFTKWTA